MYLSSRRLAFIRTNIYRTKNYTHESNLCCNVILLTLTKVNTLFLNSFTEVIILHILSLSPLDLDEKGRF